MYFQFSKFHNNNISMNNNYRYQLERYRGRGTRYTCPQCGRKCTFTRYIDTENNNQYISDNVGKCNRLDKCGYHYTPKQYFTDNPWKRDLENWKYIGNFQISKFQTPPPRPICTIPEWVVEGSINRGVRADHVRWIINTYGIVEAERLAPLKGRRVLFFPDEGKGYELWSERLPTIAAEVGFSYRISTFMEGRDEGGDIADLVNAEEVCPF